MSKYNLIFSVSIVDFNPEEFCEAMPVYGRVFDKLEHPDGSEYYLAELFKPIQRETDVINYIVVGARLAGTAVYPEMKNLAANIAYVTDESLLNQSEMDFEKGEFIGFVEITDITNTFDQDECDRLTKQNIKKWWQFWKLA